MFPVMVENRSEQRIIGLAHTGDYKQIGQIYNSIFEMASEENFWSHVRGAVAVYYDNPEDVPEDKLRSFGGLKVTRNTAVPDGLVESFVKSGRYAILTFKGPYEELGKAYDYFFQKWFPKSGEEAKSSYIYEAYLNNPKEVAPSELLTEICVPLK